MDEKKFLEALQNAIEQIDGGCGWCIDEFIQTANEGLENIGAKYRYKFVNDDNGFSAVVPVEEL